MQTAKCPGQDTRYWKADDIHDQPCPHCGEEIEFWKTDIRVRCPSCRKKVANPRFNLGCAAWCAYAEKCLGGAASGKVDRSLRELLMDYLERLSGSKVKKEEIKNKIAEAEKKCGSLMLDPLPIIAAIIYLEAHREDPNADPENFVRQLAEEQRFPAEAAAETLQILRNVLDGKLESKREKVVSGE